MGATLRVAPLTSHLYSSGRTLAVARNMSQLAFYMFTLLTETGNSIHQQKRAKQDRIKLTEAQYRLIADYTLS